ncbi:family 20 glycosylhydrolase [Agromyces sp. G08B096]|uniref:beta-N-acetylhexosaminidase n=1 Tax=Agromyces sp. G08B096 TaxID=3156399 RepID=A0AAU7W8Q1_9MICO
MRRRTRTTRARLMAAATGLLVAASALAGCTGPDQNGDAVPGIIPAPTAFELREADEPFRLTPDSRIIADGPGAADVAALLAETLRAGSGYELPVVEGGAGEAADLVLAVRETTAEGADAAAAGLDAGAAFGGPDAEAYTLELGGSGARIDAAAPAGLFRGTRSLLQLLPAELSGSAGAAPADGFAAPAASVDDRPRFTYRGAMLDVARHFLPVEEVLRYLDAIALLKLNVLHLHLTDDQGWRLQIDAWPALTEVGGETSVGGERGGFYTKDDYRRIVEHAAARFITVVPEIDLPGHTNAALSAYPELNCDGVAPAPYQGIEVGFSSLCASPERAEATDRFLADVTREVAELTPGPWLHLGGDESLATTPEDYRDLLARITAAGASTGKTVIGWHEMGASRELPRGTIGQYWSFVEAEDEAVPLTMSFVEQGGQVILSPADAAYLDMKYVDDPQTALGRTLGQDWAKGPTTLDEAYAWEPADIVPGLGEADILGVEAPIWTETMRTIDEVEFMAFPRITAIAEIGWSPAGERDHENFFARVASLATRWDASGTVYYPVRGVPWAD